MARSKKILDFYCLKDSGWFEASASTEHWILAVLLDSWSLTFSLVTEVQNAPKVTAVICVIQPIPLLLKNKAMCLKSVVLSRGADWTSHIRTFSVVTEAKITIVPFWRHFIKVNEATVLQEHPASTSVRHRAWGICLSAVHLESADKTMREGRHFCAVTNRILFCVM